MSETLIAGRYRLVDLLGRGGMSEVWAGIDTDLDRRVAVKLLAPHADNARFEREARAVASLSDPNITQLYDYGEADDRPFMVLEYLPGGTLADRLRPGTPLADDETRRIATELAAGLAHAHARGVVHRDLKPSNVLFDEEGRAKLADFGIARMVAGDGTITDPGTVLGTAAYISPEQATGAPASPASDVYSFGVLLYRMLTGRLPFESDDPLQLMNLHRGAEPTPLTELRGDAPGRLESVTTAALAKNPAERPQDGAALLAALGARDETAETRVLPAAAPEPPPRRTRAALAAAALLGVGLAGGVIAYALARPAQNTTPPPSRSQTAPATTTEPQTGSTTTGTSTASTTTAQTVTTAPPATITGPPTTSPPTTAPPPTTTPPPTTSTEPATTT